MNLVDTVERDVPESPSVFDKRKIETVFLAHVLLAVLRSQHNGILLSDLGALLTPKMRTILKENLRGLRNFLMGFPLFFMIHGQPGQEVVFFRRNNLIKNHSPRQTTSTLEESTLNSHAPPITLTIRLSGLPINCTIDQIENFFGPEINELIEPEDGIKIFEKDRVAFVLTKSASAMDIIVRKRHMHIMTMPSTSLNELSENMTTSSSYTIKIDWCGYISSIHNVAFESSEALSADWVPPAVSPALPHLPPHPFAVTSSTAHSSGPTSNIYMPSTGENLMSSSASPIGPLIPSTLASACSPPPLPPQRSTCIAASGDEDVAENCGLALVSVDGYTIKNVLGEVIASLVRSQLSSIVPHSVSDSNSIHSLSENKDNSNAFDNGADVSASNATAPRKYPTLALSLLGMSLSSRSRRFLRCNRARLKSILLAKSDVFMLTGEPGCEEVALLSDPFSIINECTEGENGEQDNALGHLNVVLQSSLAAAEIRTADRLIGDLIMPLKLRLTQQMHNSHNDNIDLSSDFKSSSNNINDVDAEFLLKSSVALDSALVSASVAYQEFVKSNTLPLTLEICPLPSISTLNPSFDEALTLAAYAVEFQPHVLQNKESTSTTSICHFASNRDNSNPSSTIHNNNNNNNGTINYNCANGVGFSVRNNNLNFSSSFVKHQQNRMTANNFNGDINHYNTSNINCNYINSANYNLMGSIHKNNQKHNHQITNQHAHHHPSGAAGGHFGQNQSINSNLSNVLNPSSLLNNYSSNHVSNMSKSQIQIPVEEDMSISLGNYFDNSANGFSNLTHVKLNNGPNASAAVRSQQTGYYSNFNHPQYGLNNNSKNTIMQQGNFLGAQQPIHDGASSSISSQYGGLNSKSENIHYSVSQLGSNNQNATSYNNNTNIALSSPHANYVSSAISHNSLTMNSSHSNNYPSSVIFQHQENPFVSSNMNFEHQQQHHHHHLKNNNNSLQRSHKSTISSSNYQNSNSAPSAHNFNNANNNLMQVMMNNNKYNNSGAPTNIVLNQSSDLIPVNNSNHPHQNFKISTLEDDQKRNSLTPTHLVTNNRLSGSGFGSKGSFDATPSYLSGSSTHYISSPANHSGMTPNTLLDVNNNFSYSPYMNSANQSNINAPSINSYTNGSSQNQKLVNVLDPIPGQTVNRHFTTSSVHSNSTANYNNNNNRISRNASIGSHHFLSNRHDTMTTYLDDMHSVDSLNINGVASSIKNASTINSNYNNYIDMKHPHSNLSHPVPKSSLNNNYDDHASKSLADYNDRGLRTSLGLSFAPSPLSSNYESHSNRPNIPNAILVTLSNIIPPPGLSIADVEANIRWLLTLNDLQPVSISISNSNQASNGFSHPTQNANLKAFIIFDLDQAEVIRSHLSLLISESCQSRESVLGYSSNITLENQLIFRAL